MNENDLDHAFASIGPTAQDRLALLERFVDYWNGPLPSDGGFGEKEMRDLRLPHSLDWFYRRFGRLKQVHSRQNRIVLPHELAVSSNPCIFCVENQGVYEWAISLAEEDPVVQGRFNHETLWTAEENSLSAFLIQWCMFEAALQAPYGGVAAWVDQDTVDRVVAGRPQVLAPWRWPSQPTRFWTGGGVLIVAGPNVNPTEEDLGEPPMYSIFVGAKNREGVIYLHDVIDKRWDSFSL